MPTLQNFTGQNLVPDLTQSLNQILGLVNAARQQKQQEEVRNAVGQAIEQAMTAPQDEQMKALGRIARLDLNAAKSVGEILASGNKAQQEALAMAADDAVKTSSYLLSIDDPTMRNKEFARVINEKQQKGQDTTKLLEIATLPADEQSLRLRQIAITGADTKKLAASVLGFGEKVPGYSNVQRTADGGLIGLSDKTGQMERIQLPEGVRLEPKGALVSINTTPPAPSGYYYVNPQQPQAGLAAIPGGPAEKATEGQMVAAGFADRMSDAEKRMNTVQEQGYNPASAVEHGRAWLGKYAESEQHQVYTQAQADWVRAKLRKESGAVITPEEMQGEIDAYFPKPGSSKAEIKAKARARKIAEEGMKRASGPQYQRSNPGQPMQQEQQVIPAPPPGFIIVPGE